MDERIFVEHVERVKREYVNRLPSWLKDPAQARVDFYVMGVYNIQQEAVSEGIPDSTAHTVRAETVLRALIDDAAKDKHSWDALKMIATKLLSAHEHLHDVLADWLAGVLEGEIQRPRKGGALQVRDMAIPRAIRDLVETYSLQPTRNISVSDECCAKGGSGCDVVGKAFDLNYKNAERLWLQPRSFHPSHRKNENK